MADKASFIIPAYNSAATLKRTVDSVLSQTYPDWEVVISVDEGSTDNTIEVAQQYDGLDRFKVVSMPHGNIQKGRNIAAQLATGDYLIPLDSDDKVSPLYLETVMPVATRHAFVSTGVTYFGEIDDGLHLPTEVQTYESELLSNQIPSCSLISRHIFDYAGGYDEELTGWEDWGLWLAILKNPDNYMVVVDDWDEHLFFYWRRAKSTADYHMSIRAVLNEEFRRRHPRFQGLTD